MANVLAQRDMNRIDGVAKVEVNLDCDQLYQFRHSSELTSEAHGGYLSGTVALRNCPIGAENKLILELVRDGEGGAHPGLLHITPSERKKRETKTGKKKKEPTVASMKVEDHQVVLKFVGGHILVQHTYFGKTDPFDREGNLDVTSCWDDENKILTLGSQNLQLTVAKPKQKGDRSTKNAVFVETVFKKKFEHLEVKPDIEKMEEEYTSKRGGPVSRLHKVHLSATWSANGLEPIQGISPKPIYDKGKYELKCYEICPNVICNYSGHTIRLLMKSSKVSAEVTVVFVLRNHGKEVARPIEAEKICGFYKLRFGKVVEAGDYKLCVFIDDAGKVVPESEHFFDLKVVAHSLNECVPCISSSMYAGAQPTNSDAQLTNDKSRRASKRHFYVNPSTSGDDPDSKVAALVLQAGHNGSIDHRNVASPANGFLLEQESSPDSGVHSNSNEKPTDQEMSEVHPDNSNLLQTNEISTDQDVVFNLDSLFDGALHQYAECAYSPGRIEDCVEFLDNQQSLSQNLNPSRILDRSNLDPMWSSSSQQIAVHSNMDHSELSYSSTDSDWDDSVTENDERIVTDGVRQRKIPDAAVPQPSVGRISVVRSRVRRSSVEENRSVAVQRLARLKEMLVRNYGLVFVVGCMGAAAICRMFY